MAEIQTTEGRGQILCIKRKSEAIFLFPEQIIMFFSRGHKVAVHTTAGDYEFAGTLNEVEQKLQDRRFFRCHHSYLVNLHMIQKIVRQDRKKYILFLQSDKTAILSRKAGQKLKGLVLNLSGFSEDEP